MSKVVEVFICGADTFDSDNYKACIAILGMCLIEPDIIVDRDKAYKLGRGNINPVDGFAIAFPNEEHDSGYHVVNNWLKLTKLLESTGRIPLIY